LQIAIHDSSEQDVCYFRLEPVAKCLGKLIRLILAISNKYSVFVFSFLERCHWRQPQSPWHDFQPMAKCIFNGFGGSGTKDRRDGLCGHHMQLYVLWNAYFEEDFPECGWENFGAVSFDNLLEVLIIFQNVLVLSFFP
jgi:hypothetical protein